MISAYAYQPQIWLICGLLFLLFELTDGSTIFFLPLGIGAGVMSVWVYLVNQSIIPSMLLSPKWYFTILLWAVISLVISLALTRRRRAKKRASANKQDDINEY